MSRLRFCGHRKSKKVATFEKAALYKCKGCQLIYSDKYSRGFKPRVVYNNYYRNEIVGRFLFGIEYVIYVFRFFRAFKLFTINPSAKSILDIGSD